MHIPTLHRSSEAGVPGNGGKCVHDRHQPSRHSGSQNTRAKRCAVCQYILAADTVTSAEGVTYTCKVRNPITWRSVPTPPAQRVNDANIL